MGIKSFSKIFEGNEIKPKSLKNLTVAVDASVISYQAALGMRNINALTDTDGNPTIHVNVVVAKCLNFHKYGMEQVWVFDYHEKDYINPAKALEIEKRKKIKAKSEKKLQALKDQKKSHEKDDMFSSDDEDINTKIQTQERVGFSMSDKIINDIKFILDCFNISWCEAPKGYEAEAICAFLTDDENEIYGDDACCDIVWTTDTDAVIYGAKQIIRELKVKQKKVLMLYDLDKILEKNELDMDDLRKIAVIAGCDHCKKTAKIGPKTILKKYKDVILTDEQQNATNVFKKTYNISNLKWHNFDEQPFEDKNKIDQLLNWLESRKFNRERIVKQINKALD